MFWNYKERRAKMMEIEERRRALGYMPPARTPFWMLLGLFGMGAYAVACWLYYILYSINPEWVSIFDSAALNMAENIPGIFYSVLWLERQGDMNRAALVAHVYGFYWVAFVFYLPLHLGIAAYQIYRHMRWVKEMKAQKMYIHVELEMLKLGGSFFIVLGIIYLIFSSFYYGSYDIETKQLKCDRLECLHKANGGFIFLPFTVLLGLTLIHITIFSGLRFINQLLKSR